MSIVPPPLIIGTITEEEQRLEMFSDYFGGVSL
jgi:hypothetical protein